MAKIKNLAELRKMREDQQKQLNLREKSNDPEKYVQIKVGMATSGIASGAKRIMDFLFVELVKGVMVSVFSLSGDMGYCYAEPTIEVMRPGEEPVVFGYVDTKRADEIIEKYIKNGELVEGIIPVNYESID